MQLLGLDESDGVVDVAAPEGVRCEPCEPDAAEPVHMKQTFRSDACTGSASDESQIPAMWLWSGHGGVLVDIQQTLDKFDEYDRKSKSWVN